MSLNRLQKFRWLRWMLGLAFVGVLIFAIAPADAQDGGLNETFDGPDLTGWEHSPFASVEDGLLRLKPGGYAFRPGAWQNPQISMNVRRSGSGELILFHHSSQGGAYILVLGDNFLLIQRESDGSVAELANFTQIDMPEDDWFLLELQVNDGDHLVFIDGYEVGSASVSDSLPAGGLGFEVHGDLTVEVDDLSVQSSNTVPVEQIQEIGDQLWVRTGGPLGGLGYDVRMHPEDPNIMYVTDAWAGVFKSTDGGQSWQPRNEGITTRGGESGDAVPIFSLTIDPHDPDIIWAGTQNVRGLFKSTNGGQSWTEMVNGIEEDDGITFRGITVDPASSDIVYAAAEISSWADGKEGTNGREFDKTTGVVYKSTDGGQTWHAIWRGENLARYIWVDPRDPDVIYISTGIFDREAANSDHTINQPGGDGIVKSTDGGQTWRAVNNGINNLYVGTLFMHPENPDILLAGTGNNAYPDGGGVYLTIDGGDSWEQVLARENINAVEFSISDPQIAYAGSAGTIFQSQDGAKTWQKVSNSEFGFGTPGIQAGFPIDFQVDPNDPQRIFANNYGGGNFLSKDGGVTWQDASSGYTGAQIRAIAVDPIEPGRVYAAARSGLFLSPDGGDNWTGLAYPPATGLEWNVVAVDPANPQHILTSNNWFPAIMESYDGAASWQQTNDSFIEGLGWRAIAFAPSDSQTVYAGSAAFFSASTFDGGIPASGVYVSVDGGANWQEANDNLSATAHVAALSIDPFDPQTVYAATTNLGLLKSIDGGRSWSENGTGMTSGVGILSVAVHPERPELVFAGLEFGGLFRSDDAGMSWEHVAAGLSPEGFVSTISFAPDDPSTMVIADRFSGVHRSNDGGTTWHSINDGLSTRAVNALIFSGDGSHIYAASEGGGVFRLDVNGVAPAVSDPLPVPAESPDSEDASEASVPMEDPVPDQTSDSPEVAELAEETASPPPASTDVRADQAEPDVSIDESEPAESGGFPFCGSLAFVPLLAFTFVWQWRRRK